MVSTHQVPGSTPGGGAQPGVNGGGDRRRVGCGTPGGWPSLFAIGSSAHPSRPRKSTLTSLDTACSRTRSLVGPLALGPRCRPADRRLHHGGDRSGRRRRVRRLGVERTTRGDQPPPASPRPGRPGRCPTSGSRSPSRRLSRPTSTANRPWSSATGEAYVYALPPRLDGTEVAGWPTTNASGPIDSTPSVTPLGGNGRPSSSGRGTTPTPPPVATRPSGLPAGQQWFTPVVNPPTDGAPAGGVQAGISRRDPPAATPDAVAGSLGQVSYALDAATGCPADRVAVLQLRQHPLHGGTGRPLRHRSERDHRRRRPDRRRGQRPDLHQRRPPPDPDRSGRADLPGRHQPGRRLVPGGGRLPRRAAPPASWSGPDAFFPGASDTDTVKAYDGQCRLRWSARLDGSTFSSPALSDVLGNGSLQVVEGTDQGTGKVGSVWVLNGSHRPDHLEADRHRSGHRLGGDRRSDRAGL